MANQNFDNNDQFILSYDLLQLMEWLIEHEAETLKKIIKKALRQGFDHKLKKAKDASNGLEETAPQDNIVNFLMLLEILLTECMHEQSVDRVLQKTLIPAIDQIDIKNCDISTVQSSVSVATSKVERNPKEDAQELFLKELLKRWKPYKKKQVVN